MLLPHYTKADLLALRYQKFYRRGSIFIYLFASLAVITVSLQSLFSVIPSSFLLLEVLSIACIIFIIVLGNKVGWHRRWIDYRLLAERLRCAVFMALIGNRNSVMFSPDDLYHEGGQFTWVSTMFQEVWHQYEKRIVQSNMNTIPFELLKRYILCAWLEDQKKFHQKKVMRHKSSHKRLSSAGVVLFALTFAAALLHLFHIGGDNLAPVWSFLAISFPVVGLTFTALRAHFEHNKLARRSEAMVKRIKDVEQELYTADNRKRLLHACRKVEILMLSENTEWHGIIGFHELEPPG